MSSEPVIRVRNVSKSYHVYVQPQDRLKQMILPKLAQVSGMKVPQYYRNFTAINDISFEISRGETVGIVGRNGSGKSTLLQMICGTLHPTSGSIEVQGRIAALLELGSGFNPEFTGRENVFLNAAILGLTQEETAQRFESIAEFAEIGHFMEQPVKTYSSGMYVRLAFAVAINVDPDILIVDEALSVGDEAFQRKCYARIEAIRASGATILFVSHGAETVVQLCDRAILIDRGEKLLEGRPKTVINHYQRMMNLTGEDAEVAREKIKSIDGWAETVAASNETNEPQSKLATLERGDEAWFDPSLVSTSAVEYGNLGATITDLEITTLDGRKVNVLSPGYRYLYRYRVRYEKSAEQVAFGMLIKNATGFGLGGSATNLVSKEVVEVPSGSIVQVEMSFLCCLAPGTYFVNAGTGIKENGAWVIWHRILDALAFKVVALGEPTHSGAVDFGILPSVALVDNDNSIPLLDLQTRPLRNGSTGYMT